MFKRFKGEFLTLPNVLTYARIALIPLIVWAYCGLHAYRAAAVLIVVSGLTDFLDGFLARHYHMITDFGKIMDPIADKLTQITVVAALGSRYPKMLYLAGMLVFKELLIGVMGLFVLKKTNYVEGAKWYGKVATILFYLDITLLIALPKLPQAVADTLILVSAIGMGAALVLYVARYSLILLHLKKQ